MKIDWKHLATTEGYKSLKACYINDVQKSSKKPRPTINKELLLKQFNWVISRAKNYSYHTGKTIEEVLNEWESGSRYWWLNRYQDSRQPKMYSGKMYLGSLKKKRIQKSKKIKPRWDSKRKKEKSVVILRSL